MHSDEIYDILTVLFSSLEKEKGCGKQNFSPIYSPFAGSWVVAVFELRNVTNTVISQAFYSKKRGGKASVEFRHHDDKQKISFCTEAG